MKNALTIMWREFRAYFGSPLGYIVSGVYFFLVGLVFYRVLIGFSNICLQSANNPYYLQQLNVNEWVVRPFFGLTRFIFLLMIPALTMRLFAEEKKNGTAELLLTAPISHMELVVGKFLGGLSMVMFLLGLSLLFPAILFWVGNPDLPPILTGFLGMVLLGASFVAIGLLASSLTDNQVIAALSSFGMIFLLWLISWVTGQVNPLLGNVLSYLSLIDHLEDFEKGVISSTHVIYYLSVIGFCLFLTQRVIESKRWR
ncbi:MAG: ABC transporter permease subunit [Acidobacteria bacterium]|nr:ABC transporter permease subunit [Acidobacteriota bacterium]